MSDAGVVSASVAALKTWPFLRWSCYCYLHVYLLLHKHCTMELLTSLGMFDVASWLPSGYCHLYVMSMFPGRKRWEGFPQMALLNKERIPFLISISLRSQNRDMSTP